MISPRERAQKPPQGGFLWAMEKARRAKMGATRREIAPQRRSRRCPVGQRV